MHVFLSVALVGFAESTYTTVEEAGVITLLVASSGDNPDTVMVNYFYDGGDARGTQYIEVLI